MIKGQIHGILLNVEQMIWKGMLSHLDYISRRNWSRKDELNR
ncbi:MAG: Hypothetical protein AJITA_00752 [Acetilactobacillus jinshanensis]